MNNKWQDDNDKTSKHNDNDKEKETPKDEKDKQGEHTENETPSGGLSPEEAKEIIEKSHEKAMEKVHAASKPSSRLKMMMRLEKK